MVPLSTPSKKALALRNTSSNCPLGTIASKACTFLMIGRKTVETMNPPTSHRSISESDIRKGFDRSDGTCTSRSIIPRSPLSNDSNPNRLKYSDWVSSPLSGAAWLKVSDAEPRPSKEDRSFAGSGPKSQAHSLLFRLISRRMTTPTAAITKRWRSSFVIRDCKIGELSGR